jgi:hypothetical protein
MRAAGRSLDGSGRGFVHYDAGWLPVTSTGTNKGGCKAWKFHCHRLVKRPMTC